jgi:hypothetical protein
VAQAAEEGYSPSTRPVTVPVQVLDLQSAADRVVRSTCATVGQRVIDIPPTMTTAERVKWIAARVTKLGITADTPRPLPARAIPRPAGSESHP